MGGRGRVPAAGRWHHRDILPGVVLDFQLEHGRIHAAKVDGAEEEQLLEPEGKVRQLRVQLLGGVREILDDVHEGREAAEDAVLGQPDGLVTWNNILTL